MRALTPGRKNRWFLRYYYYYYSECAHVFFNSVIITNSDNDDDDNNVIIQVRAQLFTSTLKTITSRLTMTDDTVYGY